MNNLYRPLQNRNIYQKYIPYSSCSPTFEGKGDTYYSLLKMANVVNQNLIQGQLLANVLKKTNIADTCVSIHQFLYNNFQYKADNSDQILRSLSCSWAERETGIDCKSYSIAASIILSNLGISHAFRRVKQPNYAPSQYTHVYVIVYNNQQSQNEKDGYYVIDGTLPTMEEVTYSEKDDFKINVSLNGLGFSFGDIFSIFGGSSSSQGGSSSSQGGTWQTIKDEAGKIDWGKWFDSIKGSFSEALAVKGNLFEKLSCLGGSAFDSGNLKQVIAEANNFYALCILRFNKAVEEYMKTPMPHNQGFNPIGHAYNEIYKDVFAIARGLRLHRDGRNWRSHCTWTNFGLAADYAEQNATNIVTLLSIYIDEYFTVKLAGITNYDWCSRCTVTGIPVNWVPCTGHEGLNPAQSPCPGEINLYIETTLKSGIKQLPAVEFTPQVANFLQNGGNLNIKDALNQVKTVISLFGTGGTGGTGNNIVDLGNNPNNGNPTTQAGVKEMNWSQIAVAGALIGSVVYFATKKGNKET